MNRFRRVSLALTAFIQILGATNTLLVASYGTTIFAIAGGVTAYLLGYLTITAEALAIYSLSLLLASTTILAFLIWRRFIRFRLKLTELIDAASDISNNNADCDKKLFHELFVRPLREEEARRSTAAAANLRTPSIRIALRQAAPSAKIIVHNNVQSVLDGAAAMYRALTGDISCATIKAIKQESDGELYLKTGQRDTACNNKRKARDSNPELLRKNKQMEEIVRNIEPYFACDNLLKAEGRKLYENSRTDWRGLYNATLVVPIYSLDGGETKSILLCIDNFHGGLNNPLAISLANYLANRLSIMLHRGTILDEFIDGTFNGRS